MSTQQKDFLSRLIMSSSSCNELQWQDRILQDIRRIYEEGASDFDCWAVANEWKLAIVLAVHDTSVHDTDAVSSTIEHLQKIELDMMMLKWSTVGLCASFGSVLCSIIQASHHLLPYCSALEGDNPILLSIDAVDWKPCSIAAVCSALISCYNCLNTDTILFLQNHVLEHLKATEQKDLAELLKSCCQLLIVSADPTWLSLVLQTFSLIYEEDKVKAMTSFKEIQEIVPMVGISILQFLSEQQFLRESDVVMVVMSFESVSSSKTVLPTKPSDEDGIILNCTRRLVDNEELLLCAATNSMRIVPPISLLRGLLALVNSSIDGSSNSGRRKAQSSRLFTSLALAYFSGDACDESHSAYLLVDVECCSHDVTELIPVLRELMMSLWSRLCLKSHQLLMSNSVAIIDPCKRLLSRSDLPSTLPVMKPIMVVVDDIPSLKTMLLETFQTLCMDSALLPIHLLAANQLMVEFLKHCTDETDSTLVMNLLLFRIKKMTGILRRELYSELIQLVVHHSAGNHLPKSSLKLLRDEVNHILRQYTTFPDCLDLLVKDYVTDINSVSCLIVEDLELLLQLAFRLDALQNSVTVRGLSEVCRVLIQAPNIELNAKESAMFGESISAEDDLQSARDDLKELPSLQFIVSLVDFVRHGLGEILHIEVETSSSGSPKKRSKNQSREDIQAIRLKSARCVTKLSIIYSALCGLNSCLVSFIAQLKCFECALSVLQVLLSTIVSVCPTTEEDETSKTVIISSHRDMVNHYVANLSGMDELCQDVDKSNRFLIERCFVNRCSWSVDQCCRILIHIEQLLSNKSDNAYADSLCLNTPLSMKWSALSHTCHVIESGAMTESEASLVALMNKLDSLYSAWFASNEPGFISALEDCKKINAAESYANQTKAVRNSSNLGYDIQSFVKSITAVPPESSQPETMVDSSLLLFEDLDYDNTELLALWVERSSQHIHNPQLLPFLRYLLTVLVNDHRECRKDLECFDVYTTDARITEERQLEDARDLFTSARTSLLKALRRGYESLLDLNWKSSLWSIHCKKYTTLFIELIGSEKFSESLYLAFLELIQQLLEGWLLQNDVEESTEVNEVCTLLLELLKEPCLSSRKVMVPSLLTVALKFGSHPLLQCCGLIESIVEPPPSLEEDGFSYWDVSDKADQSPTLTVSVKVHKNNSVLVLDYLLTYILDVLQKLSTEGTVKVDDVSRVVRTLLSLFETVSGAVRLEGFPTKVQHKVLSVLKLTLHRCVQDLRRLVYSPNLEEGKVSSCLSKLTQSWFNFLSVPSGYISLETFYRWLNRTHHQEFQAKTRQITSSLHSLRALCRTAADLPSLQSLETECRGFCSSTSSFLSKRGCGDEENDDDDGYEVMKPKRRTSGIRRMAREAGNNSTGRTTKRRRRTVKMSEVMNRNRGIEMLTSPGDVKIGDYGHDLEDFIDDDFVDEYQEGYASENSNDDNGDDDDGFEAEEEGSEGDEDGKEDDSEMEEDE